MVSLPQPTVHSDRASNLKALADALASNDLDRVDRELASLDRPPADLLRPIGMLQMQRRRWADAARMFERVSPPDLETNLKLFLCRNLDALQRHRGETYERLDPPITLTRYRFRADREGNPQIVDISEPEGPVILSTSAESCTAALQENVQRLQPACDAGKAIGLVGLGDGYMLRYLSRQPPRLLLDQQLPVHVIEPDPELVVACMMIHDYAGASGPIEQPRFRLYWGDDWSRAYRDTVLDDPSLPPPAAHFRVSRRHDEIMGEIDAIERDRQEADAAVKRGLDEHYDAVTTEALTRLLGPDPPRPPRVLIVTSRFTTVLQYSARQAMEGFAHLGWAPRLVIEPTEHHRILQGTILREIDRFRPDLLFVLDQLRASISTAVPDALPIASWIQDLLPHLTLPEAGRTVTARDFVLTFSTPLFTDDYAYPPRQCVDVPMMMASMTQRPASWESDGDDLVYVSNIGECPESITPQVSTDLPPAFHSFFVHCHEALLEHYRRGAAVPTKFDLRHWIDARADERGVRLDTDAQRFVLDGLWNPLNIALYRQQGLSWVARAAKAQGLTLAVYGRGWEGNPGFAEFARGTVTPGAPLETLCRRSRVNLNLEPYPCVTHSRLLNGLVAGGFFLVRRHPANDAMQALGDFLSAHLPRGVDDQDAARRTVDPKHRPALESLLDRGACLCFGVHVDPVRQVRCYQRAGVLAVGAPMLPRLDEITFEDPDSCAARLAEFARDDARRQAIRDEQCRAVEQRLRIDAGLGRVAQRMRRRTAEAPAPVNAHGS